MSAYRGDAGAEIEESALDALRDEFAAVPEYDLLERDPLTVFHRESGREFLLEVRAMPLGARSDG